MNTPVGGLSKIVANFYVFLVKTQHAHWNIRGQGFIFLHKFFDEVYNFAFENVDAFAERLSMKYNETLNFDFATIEKLSSLKLVNLKNSSSKDILAELEKDVAILIEDMELAKQELSKDASSDDLIIKTIEKLEMFLWQIKSSEVKN